MNQWIFDLTLLIIALGSLLGAGVYQLVKYFKNFIKNSEVAE